MDNENAKHDVRHCFCENCRRERLIDSKFREFFREISGRELDDQHEEARRIHRDFTGGKS